MLDTVLADIRKHIARAGSKGLNENNTKATLIEPLLRALGWGCAASRKERSA